MNEEEESLLENLHESNPETPESAEEPSVEEDMSAVADALLQASLLSGEEGADSPLSDPAAVDENSNPAIAVEEMLSEAMLDEPAAPMPVEAMETGAAPTFQLKIAIDKTTNRDELKKIAAEMGIALAEGALASETPIMSQLTEFQALALLQRLRASGLTASVEVKRPGSLPTEDDLALGGLAEVRESSLIQTEGAPSVKLPGNEKSVLLYSGESLPAFPVTQTLGVVTAHRSLARRFFRDEELEEKLKREMERVPGRGASNLPKSRLEGLFRELFLDLQKAALSLGGNSVLGVKIDTFPETNSLDPSLEQMRLVAFGTAAVVEKWDP